VRFWLKKCGKETGIEAESVSKKVPHDHNNRCTDKKRCRGSE